jgi:hypothetical protein
MPQDGTRRASSRPADLFHGPSRDRRPRTDGADTDGGRAEHEQDADEDEAWSLVAASVDHGCDADGAKDERDGEGRHEVSLFRVGCG